MVTDLLNNQIGSFYPGAMSNDRKRSLKEIKPTKDDLVIISPGDPGAMKKFIKECQEYHRPYLFDPGKQLPYLDNEFLKLGISKCQILISNDYELALIEKRIKFDQKKFLKEGRILITTLGGKGSQISTQKRSCQIKPAKPKEVLDPVGAGDAYLGGFLAGLVKGLDLKTCGQIGGLCAVYTIEKYGTQTHWFTKNEFAKRYKENYNVTLEL